jgi:hypothetical protein
VRRWISASEVGASVSNCSGRIPLVGQGIARVLWQSAGKGSCHSCMSLRIDSGRELLRRSKLSQVEARVGARLREPPHFPRRSARARERGQPRDDTAANI